MHKFEDNSKVNYITVIKTMRNEAEESVRNYLSRMNMKGAGVLV